jgi:hypothetical protein
MSACAMRVTLAVCLLVVLAGVAQAQGAPQSPGGQQRPNPQDTIKVPPFRRNPPVSPLGATWRSLLVPGWGQSAIGRRATGAALLFWEGVSLTMTVKAIRQLHYQEDIGAETVDAKKREVQDWIVLLVFNHLVAGAEAYASTQLWDFPTDIAVRSLPEGRVGLGLSVTW